MIKAVFFDIDGTLISFQTHIMSEPVIAALEKLRKQGIKLFIATGRAPSNVTFIQDFFTFDGFVTMNGQYCFCKDELIYEHSLLKTDVTALIEQSKKETYTYCFVEPHDIYIDKVTDAYISITNMVNIPLPRICVLDYPLTRKIYQLIVSVPEEHEHIITDATENMAIARWHPAFVDVIPKDGGKDVGIAAMLDYFHIKKEETMAFGDGHNDVSMLQFAGCGVAMGNAAVSVQEKADYVTASVDEDGIVRALQHYSLI